MLNGNSRREVKNVLYGYYANITYLKRLENDVVFSRSPYRDRHSKGRVSDPTAIKSMMMDDEERAEIKREINAVQQLLAELERERRDSK